MYLCQSGNKNGSGLGSHGKLEKKWKNRVELGDWFSWCEFLNLSLSLHNSTNNLLQQSSLWKPFFLQALFALLSSLDFASSSSSSKSPRLVKEKQQIPMNNKKPLSQKPPLCHTLITLLLLLLLLPWRSPGRNSDFKPTRISVFAADALMKKRAVSVWAAQAHGILPSFLTSSWQWWWWDPRRNKCHETKDGATFSTTQQHYQRRII
jgi:hypothetical protein